MFVLGDPAPAAAPKLAALTRLRAAGLPVPPGFGLEPEELADPEVRAHLTTLLADGPVIVRAGLHREDTADASAAGLGLSIADCRDLDAVDRAAAAIAEASRDPWLVRYSCGSPSYQLLVQRQVERRWLAVLAADRDGAPYLELHDATHPEALAAGATPSWSGPLALCDRSLAGPITSLFEHVLKNMPEVPALDLELIVDPAGVAWLVQARPLARPLVPGWPDFLAVVAPGRDAILGLPGLWRLDAEHNPAALSPAHAGVIAWLADRGTSLRVLAGWLYEPVAGAPETTVDTVDPGASVIDEPSTRLATTEPTLRADPGAPVIGAPSVPKPSPTDPRDVLAELRERHLPAARQALADLDLLKNLPARLARALEHLRATLAVYATVRVDLPRELAGDRDAPLSLRERAAFLDVLPATWDLASPALADLVDPTCFKGLPDPAADPPDRERAAVLVRELDDHLFALGLAPLRRAYLAIGDSLGLGDDVFLFTPDELAHALAGRALPDREERRHQHRREADLRPPPALFDGRPVPLPPHRRLHGLPIGASVSGPIARRRDLHDLLARPPTSDAIVVLPALTAQAAVALRALAVRAVCCEHGGALSHATLMARELGLSALIGCAGCSELADGTVVELDTRAGRLRPGL